MSEKKHDVESEGAKPRNHVHPRPLIWKRLHRDWRFWFAVGLMLALTLVYVMTDNLYLRPDRGVNQSAPRATVP